MEENKHIRSFLDSVKIHVSAFGRFIHQPYLACFCESPRILSQWRSYGESGKGYCIGLKFSEKTKILADLENPEKKYDLYLRKVIYSEEKQNFLVNTFLDESANCLSSILKNSGFDDRKKNQFSTSIAAALNNILIDMILCFKHEAFKEEKEWRLIRVLLDYEEPETVRFREKESVLIPYLKTNIIEYLEKKEEMSFPISSLFFGPSLDKNVTESALRIFLFNQSKSDSKILIKNPGRIKIDGMGYTLRS
ncbi:MAG: DUF2971 domain-containing protein [Gracilimonas sp.]